MKSTLALAGIVLAIVITSARPALARSPHTESADTLSVEEHAFRAILSKEERTEFLAIPEDPPSLRAGWRRRFWRRNDPDPTTISDDDGAGAPAGDATANERLAEHRARIARARELFGSARGLLWDDRCAAIVRFGEPLVRVQDGGETRNRYGLDPPRERWLYDQRFLYMEDRNLDGRFEYGISPRVSNIGNVDNIGENDEFFRNGQVNEPVNTLTDFEGHPEVDAHFSDLSTERLKKMLENGRKAWAKEASTFTAPKTGKEIPFFFDLSTFRGRDGQSDLVANYLIPLEAVRRDADGAWLERRTVVLDDSFGLAGSEMESIEHAVEGGTARGKWVLNATTIALAPGHYEVASRVVDLLSPERTMGLIRTRAAVPDYGGDALQMSDVLFGTSVEADTLRAGRPGTVVRNGWRVVPQPVRRFDHSATPCLYFEVYNLTAGGDGRYRYQVEYALSRREKKGFLASLLGGGKAKLSPGVTATFDRECRAADDSQWIGIDTSDLPADTYSIETRVRDLVGGGEASRKETFVIVGEAG